jgi:hypothetical protein
MTTTHTTMFDEAVAKVTEEQKKITRAAIDTYEESVLKFVDSYEKAVADTKVHWLKDAIAPQVTTTRQATTAYVTAVRQLVN